LLAFSRFSHPSRYLLPWLIHFSVLTTSLLQDCGIANESTFSSFLQGLNSAHSLITVVDVGAQKEAADQKIQTSIRLFSKLPSCKLVLAGTTHDGGYAHLFSSLETEAPAQFKKITLLKSYEAAAFEIKRMGLKEVTFPHLFEPKKLNSWAGQAGTGGAPATPGGKKTMGPSYITGGNATPVAPGWGVGGGKTPKTVKKDKLAEAMGKLSVGGDSAVKKIKLVPTDPTKVRFSLLFATSFSSLSSSFPPPSLPLSSALALTLPFSLSFTSSFPPFSHAETLETKPPSLQPTLPRPSLLPLR
jgi:hypothetical protein